MATAALWAAAGCASSGAAPGAMGSPAAATGGEPATGNQESANVPPPPRGQTQPRLADMPQGDPLEPGGDADEGGEERFLTLHGEEHKRRQQRAAAAKASAVPNVDVLPSADPKSCAGLSGRERMTCPLNMAGPTEKITDIPAGVRLQYQRDPAITAEKMQQIIDCQKALAAADPRNPPFCPVVDTATTFSVSERGGRLVVDVIHGPGGDVGVVRQQVRSAFSRRSR